ncbi:hypothetical protein D3C85_784330 [compost metagenome]
MSVHRDRAGDGVDQPVGHVGRVGGFKHFAQHDEFVAAQAGDRVLRAQGLADALGQVDQQGVARVVSVGIVDRLETVQVEKQHREVTPAAAGAFDGLLQPVFQQDAVGQFGQGVVQCKLHQLFIGFRQRRRQRGGACFETVVQHRDDQCNGQHAQRHGGHGDGQPAGGYAGVGRHADAAGRKAGCLHARIVHADDGHAHDDGGQRPR